MTSPGWRTVFADIAVKHKLPKIDIDNLLRMQPGDVYVANVGCVFRPPANSRAEDTEVLN